MEIKKIVETPKLSYKHDIPEQMLDTIVTNYPVEDGEDFNQTFREELTNLKRNVDRNKTQLTQVYISCKISCVEALEHNLKTFFNYTSLELYLPENYSLSLGIWPLVKELLDKNMEQIEDREYAIVFVRNFTDIVASKEVYSDKVQSGTPQIFTHLYNQNTGEDITSAFAGLSSKKTFQGYPTKILILTIINDTFGLELQTNIARIASQSDFAKFINIP